MIGGSIGTESLNSSIGSVCVGAEVVALPICPIVGVLRRLSGHRTLTETSAVSEYWPDWSVIVYVNWSVPQKSASGT